MCSVMNRKCRIVEFVEGLKKLGLESDNYEEALKIGELYGRILWNNYLGVYRDDDFEENLVSRFEKSLEIDWSCPQREEVLHVISEPYGSGGHTRLLEKLVSSADFSSHVLVSRSFNNEAGILNVAENIKVIHSSDGYQLIDLVQIISCYKKVVLHMHPDDLKVAVAVGVVRRSKNIRVVFVNHADHVFSFGFYSVDMVAEVSGFGFTLSKNYRNVSSSYLGIPIKESNYRSIKSATGPGLQIFSAGSPYKFKPLNGFSFPLLVRTILHSLPNATITIVGPSLSNRWWLWTKLVYPKRLRITPLVSYDEYRSIVRKADLYIDSLPICGGTSFPEMRALGVPVTGVLTGAHGYTPCDNTKFASCGELVSEIEKLSKHQDCAILLRNQSEKLLGEMTKAHNLVEIAHRFGNILGRGQIYSPVGYNEAAVDKRFYQDRWEQKSLLDYDKATILSLLRIYRAYKFRYFIKLWRLSSWGRRYVLLKGLLLTLQE